MADVLAKMLSPGGQAWIADPYRAAAEEFPRAVAARGLECSLESVRAESLELGPIGGTLHRVTRGVMKRSASHPAGAWTRGVRCIDGPIAQ